MARRAGGQGRQSTSETSAARLATEVSARHRLESLSDLAQALSNSMSLDEVARVVVERGRVAAAADICTLHLLDEPTQTLGLLAAVGVSAAVVAQIREIAPGSDNPVVASMTSGAPIWVETAAEYAKLYPSLAGIEADGPRARAFWSVPLIAEGRPLGLLGMGFYAERGFPPEEREFVRTFARHSAEALRRAERFEARSRDDARRAFLAAATTTLADSLDYEETLSRVARLAVPEMADWCGVDIVTDEHGATRVLAVAHVDPAKIELARELTARYPAAPDSPTGVPSVVRSGRAELYPEVTDALVAAAAIDADHLALLRALALRSVMVVPLRARERVLGAITLIRSTGGRAYTQEDLAAAEELGRRCAIAIDNARLFAGEQQAREAAVIANRAKDYFLAAISHELRTPLTAIMGWAKMLSTTPHDESMRRRGMETIERNAVSMARLIEDLLDLSRIASGKIALESRTVELATVISAAIESVKPAAETKGVTLAASLDPPTRRLQGDAVRLQQVVSNLLSNAVKFTPRDGRVVVTLRSTATAAEIEVRDTGKGIDGAFLPHVFELFRQEHASHARSRGGLGLGLAISRQLVELHGGRVTAASDGEGTGATFVVVLPFAAGAGRSSTAPPPVASIPPQLAAGELDGLRVLVVDDDDDTRAYVRTVLEVAGSRVVTARSVPDAMAALDHEVPDLVISDIGMAGEDGYDFIRRLRALSPAAGGTLPAAALTAFAYPEDRRRVLDAGYTIHLAKPIDPGELVSAVARLGRSAAGA